MMIDATDFLMMLACTGFVVLTANIISRGFESLWKHVYAGAGAAPEAVIATMGEPLTDERHLLPEGRGPIDSDVDLR